MDPKRRTQRKKEKDLNDNIDTSQIKDRTLKLQAKVKFKMIKFMLRMVTEQKLKKVMHRMQKKEHRICRHHSGPTTTWGRHSSYSPYKNH